MTSASEELSKLLQKQKALLVAVATYGPRVKAKLAEYANRRARIRDLMDQVGIQDPIPFPTLWKWYQRWNDGSLPTYESRRTYIEHMIEPHIDRLNAGASLPSRQRKESTDQSDETLDIFVSHSAKDRKLAGQLAHLLRSALNLAPDRIRCTSVDGYRLRVGVDSNESLRKETQRARAVVALLTPNSLNSPFVLFELGARWGAGQFLAPVAAGGLSLGELKAPLSGMNVLQLSSRAQVFQLIQDIAGELKREVVSPAVFNEEIKILSADN